MTFADETRSAKRAHPFALGPSPFRFLLFSVYDKEKQKMLK